MVPDDQFEGALTTEGPAAKPGRRKATAKNGHELQTAMKDRTPAASSAAEAVEAALQPVAGAKRKARIEHKVPGRIRMKVPAAKEDPAILASYHEIFSQVPGVTQVKTRPETGSIVIHYDAQNAPAFEQHFHDRCGAHLHMDDAAQPEDEVNEMARKIEVEAEFLAEHSHFARVSVDFFKAFDRELKITTENTVDLKLLLAGGLAAFTFLEIGAAAATPMWVTLGLFSLNHFVELRGEDERPRQPTKVPDAA